MLKHLRELLLKQATPELREYLGGLDDVVLSSAVLESLQKARAAGTVNPAKSAAVAHSLPLGEDAHPLEGLDASLIHDALGHHLTHYKAALKAGNRELANQHLAATMRTIHHAYTMEREHGLRRDPGKGVSLPVRIRSGVTASIPGGEGEHLLSPKPWEMVYSGSKRKENGDHAETPKLWGREIGSRGMFTDHAYMESAPNPHHADSKKAYNLYGYEDSAYPFHEVQVNGHHVVIDDVDSPGEFKSHVLDSHPALKHAYTSTKDWAANAEHNNSALEAQHKAWLQSPELEEWLNQQMEKDADPTHLMRGMEKSGPVVANPTNHGLDPVYGKLSGKRGPQSAEQQVPLAAPIVKPEYAKDPNFKPVPDKSDEGTVAAMVHSLAAKGTSPDAISKIFRIPPEEVERLTNAHQGHLDNMDEAAHTLLAAGHDPKDIAKQLNIAHSSVKAFANRHEMRQMLKDIADRKASEEK